MISINELKNSIFKNCIKLETINFPKVEVLSMEVFKNTSLKKVELNSVISLRNYFFSSVYNPGKQFSNCAELTHVTMKNITYIDIKMFENCPLYQYIFYKLNESLNNIHYFSN